MFPANLMKLPFGEFDLILGIDLLVEHRVSLDCVPKRVTLRIEENSKIVLIGSIKITYPILSPPSGSKNS